MLSFFNTMKGFSLRSFVADDEATCKQLLWDNIVVQACAGQNKAYIDAETEYVKESCSEKGDMSRIREVYFKSGGHFWTLVDDQGHVKGMVGLEMKGNGRGELRRMHLDKDCRGKGLGHRMVDLLFAYAINAGLECVFLSTVDRLTYARNFYASCGFKELPEKKCPLHDAVDTGSFEVHYEIVFPKRTIPFVLRGLSFTVTRPLRPVLKEHIIVDKMGSGPGAALHHAIELRPHPVFGGFGLFATKKIAAETLIWRHIPSDWEEQSLDLTWTELAALSPRQHTKSKHFGYQVSETHWQVPPLGLEEKDWSNFMNHSCDPTCWFLGYDIIARRDIEAGEEITYDYATSQSSVDPLPFPCGCGTPKCRKNLRADDWLLPSLQQQYGHHFSPYMLGKVGFYEL